MNLELVSSCEEDTIGIARALGSLLKKGDVVALTGELGAGKTVFCKGIGESLGVPRDRVVSPSFTIVTEHEGPVSLYHVDAYRLSSEREACDIGIEEFLEGKGVCVVEWAERIGSLLPKHCIKVRFLFLDDQRRRLVITADDRPRIREFAARCIRYLPGG